MMNGKALEHSVDRLQRKLVIKHELYLQSRLMKLQNLLCKNYDILDSLPSSDEKYNKLFVKIHGLVIEQKFVEDEILSYKKIIDRISKVLIIK